MEETKERLAECVCRFREELAQLGFTLLSVVTYDDDRLREIAESLQAEGRGDGVTITGDAVAIRYHGVTVRNDLSERDRIEDWRHWAALYDPTPEEPITGGDNERRTRVSHYVAGLRETNEG